MTERERLAEMIKSAMYQEVYTPEKIAERLIDEGVICPPCKVGDTVWLLKNPIERWEVARVEKILNDVRIGIKFAPRGSTVYVRARYIGDLLFFSREEAEAALAERRKA